MVEESLNQFGSYFYTYGPDFNSSHEQEYAQNQSLLFSKGLLCTLYFNIQQQHLYFTMLTLQVLVRDCMHNKS